MPKSKKVKQAKSWQKNNILFIIFASTVAIVLFFFIQYYNQSSLENKFYDVEQRLKEVQNLLNTQKDAELTIEKECYRNAGKFSDGPLECAIRLVQDDSLDSEINEIIELLQSSGFVAQDNISTKDNIIDFENKNIGLECRLFYSPRFELFCANESKKAFYPHRD